MIQNTLIAKYLSGNATSEEVERLERLMVEDSSVQEQVQIAKILWENSPSEMETDVDALWNQIDSEISTPERPRIIPLRRSVTRVAAVVAFFVLSVFIFKLLETETFEQGIVLNTQVSAKKVGLADGSVATVQPYSNLALDENFNQEDRKMRLTGNAYFVVKPDKQRTFEVSTPHLKVFVLGTAFSIEESNDTSFVLVDEGKVKVEVNEKVFYLTANQKLVATGNTATVTEFEGHRLTQLDMANPAASFESVSLDQVIRALEVEHTCTIHANKELLSKTVTLSLDGLTLSEKLDIISEMTGTNVSEESGNFYLK